jgi:riboflavin biosynthesis pyrimidine reductase
MRILLASRDGNDISAASLHSEQIDLHEHYACGWLTDGGVRMNFVSSVDGGATVSGRSQGLQTPGDNAVFATLRDLADVIVVGGATATTEGYKPATPSTERRRIRRSYGLNEVPAIAVLSGSLNLDLAANLYSSADREAPTIIVTGSSAPLARRNDIIDLAESVGQLQLLETPATTGGEVDFGAAVAQLRELGYQRILCEGGPRLFSAALLARSVDELCLTISPMLVGPGGLKIVGGQPWPDEFLPQLRLDGMLVEDDALFCRYRIQH